MVSNLIIVDKWYQTLLAQCMVTTFIKHFYQYMVVPNSDKTCRKTGMDKQNGGQDAKCLPSLKLNFRYPPTQSNQKLSGQTMHTNTFRDCTIYAYILDKHIVYMYAEVKFNFPYFPSH